MVALHGRIQPEGPDYLVVGTRVEEACAGDGDEVGDAGRIQFGAGVHGRLRSVDKKLGGLAGKDFIPHLCTGVKQQSGGRVKELGIVCPEVHRHFLDSRVTRVDRRRVEAGAYQSGTKPGQPGLRRKNVPGFCLDQHRRRDSSFQ